MFKKIFKKSTGNNNNNEYVLITALLIHAAKMDENFTTKEKNIIKKAIMSLFKLEEKHVNDIYNLAEEKEDQRLAKTLGGDK